MQIMWRILKFQICFRHTSRGPIVVPPAPCRPDAAIKPMRKTALVSTWKWQEYCIRNQREDHSELLVVLQRSFIIVE